MRTVLLSDKINYRNPIIFYSTISGSCSCEVLFVNTVKQMKVTVPKNNSLKMKNFVKWKFHCF